MKDCTVVQQIQFESCNFPQILFPQQKNNAFGDSLLSLPVTHFFCCFLFFLVFQQYKCSDAHLFVSGHWNMNIYTAHFVSAVTGLRQLSRQHGAPKAFFLVFTYLSWTFLLKLCCIELQQINVAGEFKISCDENKFGSGMRLKGNSWEAGKRFRKSKERWSCESKWAATY